MKFEPKKVIKFSPEYAQPLWVLENEAIKIMSQDEVARIEFGPKVLLMEPYERPFVMTIAGGTPKNTKRLKIWKIKLGPNFSTDIPIVRTSDNAELAVTVRYKWKFNVNKDDPKESEKIFSVSDFVGLATETMASKIRDEAAKHTFEELHSGCSEILRKAVFGKGKDSYEFDNGFHIFGFDIKEIKPKDTDIANKMNEAIKSNMQIVVDKVKQEAELEAEKLKNNTKKEIEEARSELIKRQQENSKLERTGEAKIEAEAITIRAQAEADAIKIRKVAEAEGEVEKIQRIMALLKGKDGEFKSFIEVQKLEALKNMDKIAIVEGGNTIMSLADLFKKD